MHLCCVNQNVVDYANSARPTSLPVLLLLRLLLLLMLTPGTVCGCVATGVRCLLHSAQFCTKLQEEWKKVVLGMCTKNPKAGGKRSVSSVAISRYLALMLVVALSGVFFFTSFCSQCSRTNVGHGHVTTLFLSSILFFVLDPNFFIFCWPSTTELVCLMVWPRWGATNSNGRALTQGSCALKQNCH